MWKVIKDIYAHIVDGWIIFLVICACLLVIYVVVTLFIPYKEKSDHCEECDCDTWHHRNK